MEFGGRQFTNRGTTENPIYDLSGDGSGGSFGDNVTRISGTIDKATAPRQSANQSSNALWYETLTNMLYLSDPLYDLSSFDINNPDLVTSLDIRVHAAVKDTRPVDTLSYGSRSDGTSVFDLSLRISRYPRDLGSTTGQFFPVYIDSHGHNVGNQFEFEDVNNSNPAEYISVHSRFGNTPSVYEWSNYQHYFKGGTDKHTFLTATLGPHQTAWLEVYSLNGKLHLGMAANHANVYDWTDTMEYTVEIRPSAGP
ncbi:MAG TPA: hypothetical protein DCR04_12910 [Flavobacteriales bacterium]|nr:hypothetical protein [Flavobacteriales bacterium]